MFRVEGKEMYTDCRECVRTITRSGHVWLGQVAPAVVAALRRRSSLVMFSVRCLAEVSKHDTLYLPNKRLTRQLADRTDQQVLQPIVPFQWRHYFVTLISLVPFS